MYRYVILSLCKGQTFREAYSSQSACALSESNEALLKLDEVTLGVSDLKDNEKLGVRRLVNVAFKHLGTLSSRLMQAVYNLGTDCSPVIHVRPLLTMSRPKVFVYQARGLEIRNASMC